MALLCPVLLGIGFMSSLIANPSFLPTLPVTNTTCIDPFARESAGRISSHIESNLSIDLFKSVIVKTPDALCTFSFVPGTASRMQSRSPWIPC
jgi:hypothetical protein